jgi:hypothetical protein
MSGGLTDLADFYSLCSSYSSLYQEPSCQKRPLRDFFCIEAKRVFIEMATVSLRLPLTAMSIVVFDSRSSQ